VQGTGCNARFRIAGSVCEEIIFDEVIVVHAKQCVHQRGTNARAVLARKAMQQAWAFTLSQSLNIEPESSDQHRLERQSGVNTQHRLVRILLGFYVIRGLFMHRFAPRSGCFAGVEQHIAIKFIMPQAGIG
jgi:hypothetical protein